MYYTTRVVYYYNSTTVVGEHNSNTYHIPIADTRLRADHYSNQLILLIFELIHFFYN